MLACRHYDADDAVFRVITIIFAAFDAFSPSLISSRYADYFRRFSLIRHAFLYTCDILMMAFMPLIFRCHFLRFPCRLFLY